MTSPVEGAPRNVFISGLAVYLPESRFKVETAVADGIYDSERAARDGFASVAVEPHLYPLDMALNACRTATAGLAGTEISSLIFTSIHRHGHKNLWPPASYLHHQLGMAPDALAYSLNHGCNGAFIAAKTAMASLQRGTDSNVVIAGADRFEESLCDRWNSDHGTVYGDAASAIVLSTDESAMQVLCLEINSGTVLEAMYRDPVPSAEREGSAVQQHDVGAAKRAYFQKNGRDEFDLVFTSALRRLREKLLSQYRLIENPAAYVVYPNVGAGISASLYAAAFGDLAKQHCWEFGRSVGHTGVSDQFIGLHHIVNSKSIGVGDRILLIGAGNGLSVSVMLLEIK